MEKEKSPKPNIKDLLSKAKLTPEQLSEVKKGVAGMIKNLNKNA